MNEIKTLYGHNAENITLAEALENCAEILQDGIALLYSPTCCQFAKLLPKSILQDSQGKDIPLEYTSNYIFEARIFNSQFELRWLNELDGKGQAALIFDNQSLTDKLPDWQSQEIPNILTTIKQQYLLWGEKTNQELIEGWQRLASARIGSLDVPVNQVLQDQQRVYLKTIEYLVEVNEAEVDKPEVDEENGNVAVIEERLMKLEVK